LHILIIILLGWTPLEEAQASGTKEIIEQIYISVQHTSNKEFKERTPKLVELLRKVIMIILLISHVIFFCAITFETHACWAAARF